MTNTKIYVRASDEVISRELSKVQNSSAKPTHATIGAIVEYSLNIRGFTMHSEKATYPK